MTRNLTIGACLLYGTLVVLALAYVLPAYMMVVTALKMPANRLGVEVHIITGSAVQIQNILRCVNQVGFEVEGLIPEAVACGYTALSKEEKKLGVILINIGEGLIGN